VYLRENKNVCNANSVIQRKMLEAKNKCGILNRNFLDTQLEYK